MSIDFVTREVLFNLRKSKLFNGLTENELKYILSNCRHERLPRRSLILSTGNNEERFYVPLKGRIRIEAQNARTGRSITLYILKPGDGYDLTHLLAGQTHNFQAETLDIVEIASAPLGYWRTWLDIFPALYQAAASCTAERLYEIGELVQNLALYDTPTRLARLLLKQVDGEMEEEINAFHDMAHEDIASLIGTVREVASRLINQLKRERIIATKERRIHIIDSERLRLKAKSGFTDGMEHVRQSK